jgi:hypothetical protein
MDGRLRVQVTSSGEDDLRPSIFRLAASSGWTLWELHRERTSLEHLFRDLTLGAPKEESMTEVQEPEVETSTVGTGGEIV